MSESNKNNEVVVKERERVLSKKDILGGTSVRTQVYFEEFKGNLSLRPLNDYEWNSVEAIRSRGTTIKGVPNVNNLTDNKASIKDAVNSMEMGLDIEELMRADFQADCLAVAYSLGDDWSTEDVKLLSPPGIVKKIANEVYSLSGVTPSDNLKDVGASEVERFRDK